MPQSRTPMAQGPDQALLGGKALALGGHLAYVSCVSLTGSSPPQQPPMHSGQWVCWGRTKQRTVNWCQHTFPTFTKGPHPPGHPYHVELHWVISTTEIFKHNPNQPYCAWMCGHDERVPLLGLMVGCHHCSELLDNLGAGPTFPGCAEPCECCGWSCRPSSRGHGTRQAPSNFPTSKFASLGMEQS